MNQDILVRVDVEISDRDPEIGTGYPINEGRILTARHVVSGWDREKGNVKVVWRNLGSEGQRPSAKVKDVWMPSEEKVDIAILYCDFPAAVRGPFGAISSQSPRSGDPWQTHGFASAEAKDDKRPLVPLKGTCFQPSGSSDFHFDLGVDAPTSMNNGWRGVSGAPVFVEGEIKGVIFECLDAYKQGRLRATRLDLLFGDPAFRLAAGLPSLDEIKDFAEKASEARRSALQKLENLIQQSQSLANEMAKRLKVTSPNERMPKALAQILMGKNTEEVLDIFHGICLQWGSEFTKWPRDVIPGDICEAVFDILPCLVDLDIIQSLSRQGTINWVPKPVAIHTEHMAEIAMAARDARTVQASTIVDDGIETFRAEHAISAPPTVGFDFKVDDVVESITDDLLKTHAKAHRSSREQKIKNANNALGKGAANKFSKYITIFPEQGAECPLFLDYMSKIKGRFSNITIVPLDPSDEISEKENTIPDSIEYFLKLAARTK